MSAQELTPRQVMDFASHMKHVFGASIVRKEDALEMRLAARILEWAGIMPRDAFMNRFATVIGRTLYLPFVPGDAKTQEALWRQIVTLTHEMHHIVQRDREGCGRFEWMYLTSTAERARIEAEAYRTEMELTYWRTGRVPSPRRLASRLRSYGCSEADVAVTEVALTMSQAMVERGAVLSKATREALAWLQAHVPHLKHGTKP